MVEKLVRFNRVEELDRVSRSRKFLFNFIVVDMEFFGKPEQRSQEEQYYMIIGISDSLWTQWVKNSTTFNTPDDQAKVIYEVARREVEQKVKEGLLQEEFTVEKGSYDYSTSNNQCPYDPAFIADFGEPFIVTIPNGPIEFKTE